MICGDGATAPAQGDLPRSLLYAIAAPVGGHGLGMTSAQSLRASVDAGILGGVVGMRVDRRLVGDTPVRDLSRHPARLLRYRLDGDSAMAARKHAVAGMAAAWLRRGNFDFFHGWSGDALDAMIAARRRDIPCVLDIPTWHRDKGEQKRFYTQADRGRSVGRYEISRQQVLTEYAMADLVFVQSRAAAESFLGAGFPENRLYLLGRGVDPEQFQPTRRPDCFRLVFLGTLCRRKGVHHLLAAWKKLALPNAELVLVGGVDEDVRDDLRTLAGENVKVTGFEERPQDWLECASAFVLASGLEGAAKAVYEAAACGLPLIATRETGDVIKDGVNGLCIPPDNEEALAEAIRALHADPDRAAAMGRASRARVLERFTWDHHRRRLLHAYASLMRGRLPTLEENE